MNGARPTQTATIRVRGLKVALPLAPDQIPRDLVPPEPAPAGEPVLVIALEGSSLAARARLNGKGYRKMLKALAEHGADDVAVILQGTLCPPAAAGQPHTLEGAGFQVVVKTPKPGGGATPP